MSILYFPSTAKIHIFVTSFFNTHCKIYLQYLVIWVILTISFLISLEIHVILFYHLDLKIKDTSKFL